jgi:hypothetical protein
MRFSKMARKDEELYSDIKDLAQDSKNLMFQLINDRIRKFDIPRTLGIDTFFLNYFLVHIYFPGFEMTNQFLPNWKPYTNEQEADFNHFKRYVEILHGLFIMIPMKYQEKSEKYSAAETDIIIDRVDAYGDFTNSFFHAHENVKQDLTDINKMEDVLKGFDIIYRFLPDLEFDPEFNKIVNSKAINQLYHITYPANFLKEHGISRYNYPINIEIQQEFDEAMKDWNATLFHFDPNLLVYSNFLKNACNHVLALDFGSEMLINEVISLFTEYYSL